MGTMVLQLSGLFSGQIETAEKLVTMLQNGGPWAILAIALAAIAWLAKAYVQARDDRDAAVSGMNEKLTGLLKDVTIGAEQQKAANEKTADLLERIERKLDVPAK